MKTYSITIPDNKEALFIEWMKSISFVEKIEAVHDLNIPEEHKQTVRKRIQYSEEHPDSMLSWKEVESKLKL